MPSTSILFTSPQDTIELPEVTLHELIQTTAARRGSATALLDATSGHTLTYAELSRGIDSVASALVSKGLAKQDVVAIISANSPEYALAALGVMAAGGVVSGVNPTYTAPELLHQLTDAGATRVIVAEMFLPAVIAIANEAALEEIIVIGEAEGATPFRSLLDHSLDPVHVIVEPSDLAALPYSSGTTGRSKGVKLTHANLVANLRQASASFPISADDQVLVFLPMFHIFGFAVVTMVGLESGATLVTVPMFEPTLFCETIQNHRINKLYVVPPVMNFLAGHPMVDQYDMSSIEILGSGAAPLGAAMELAAADRLGCLVGQGFGMTEVSGTATMPLLSGEDLVLRPGSSGQLVANMEAMIVDPESGDSLGPHETGELWLRGPNCFDGYRNNTEATDATIDSDGWLHTGDLCHFDDDGFLFVTDRLKELIKVKGFQVAPAELEALLLTHPSVIDAAVVGRPDERSGEVPVAHLVAHDGIDVEEVRSFVAERVTEYKRLADVIITDQIPKNPSGKILRRELRGA